MPNNPDMKLCAVLKGKRCIANEGPMCLQCRKYNAGLARREKINKYRKENTWVKIMAPTSQTPERELLIMQKGKEIIPSFGTEQADPYNAEAPPFFKEDKGAQVEVSSSDFTMIGIVCRWLFV